MKKNLFVLANLILLQIILIGSNSSADSLEKISSLTIANPTLLAGSFSNKKLQTNNIASSGTMVQNQTETDTISDGSPDQDDDMDLFEEYEQKTQMSRNVADPFYYFNYAMYSFNDFLYFYALKPVAQGYKAVVPTIARKGVSNFFHNLMFPVRFVNNILQGKLEQASDEIGIFLVNSTAGVLGLNQVAQKHLNMHTSNEDLGQTMGYYSIKEGFYLVLPVLGSSTLRDAVGRIGDYFITPVNYAEPWELNLGLTIADTINTTSFRIGDYEALKEASLDPYVAIRSAYIQNRRTQASK